MISTTTLKVFGCANRIQLFGEMVNMYHKKENEPLILLYNKMNAKEKTEFSLYLKHKEKNLQENQIQNYIKAERMKANKTFKIQIRRHDSTENIIDKEVQALSMGEALNKVMLKFAKPSTEIVITMKKL